jgi:hypothetical protein
MCSTALWSRVENEIVAKDFIGSSIQAPCAGFFIKAECFRIKAE